MNSLLSLCGSVRLIGVMPIGVIIRVFSVTAITMAGTTGQGAGQIVLATCAVRVHASSLAATVYGLHQIVRSWRLAAHDWNVLTVVDLPTPCCGVQLATESFLHLQVDPPRVVLGGV